MHEIQFADAVIPARNKILGLVLRPYSIGHEIIFLSARNPLILSGFEQLGFREQKEALINAVLVCQRSWIQNQCAEKNLRLWRWINRNSDYQKAIEDFEHYRISSSAEPPHQSVSGNTGRSLGAPFHAALIQFLIQFMGKTELQAYDYPLGLAKFHYFTHVENEGGLEIINREQMEFEKYCAEEDEKATKAKEEKCRA